MNCDDGTTKSYGGAGWSEWPWYFEGRTVTVDEKQPIPPSALHFAGTFRRASASGTFRYSKVFINGEVTSAVLCTTGDLTWTAERLR